MTLANKLTLARLVLALITFACLWRQEPAYYVAATVLYILATITDWVDGYVARSTGSVSPFGKVADPIADKVLVIGAMIAFVRIPILSVPAWAVFLIIVRELVIGGLRALAGIQGKVMAADRGGKWKMVVQSVSVMIILLLLLVECYRPGNLPGWVWELPHHLIVLSMLVSLLSGVQYLYASRAMLRKSWNAQGRE
jgi:CDP-diacylglycerol---glycerol-3-phosphate 3-phosphatidyltransferase